MFDNYKLLFQSNHRILRKIITKYYFYIYKHSFEKINSLFRNSFP